MTPKEYIMHPTLCSLPWIGVYVGPNGVVKNCAITSQSLGNLHQQSIEQCVNSDINKQIKTDMIDKISHPRCSACYKVETLNTNTMQSQSKVHYKRKVSISCSELQSLVCSSVPSGTKLTQKFNVTKGAATAAK